MQHRSEDKSVYQRALNSVKANPLGWGILALIILFIFYSIYKSTLGPKIPGAFLERSSYDNKIYVLVYPTKDSVKNYYVPGDITRDENGYSITSATWPDGGYSTFDNCQIYLDKKTACTITNSKQFIDLVNDPNSLKNIDVQRLESIPDFYVQLTSNPVSK
jgi:hypothetical protein